MNVIYNDLKKFWNDMFNNDTIEKIEEEYIKEESFINLSNKYFKKDSVFLDYGCGSGWCLLDLSMKLNLKEGIGIDPSENGIKYANKVKEISEFNNINFICGDESTLSNYQNYFDSGISVNTLDVVPDEIIESILSSVKKSLKKDAYFLVCLNPVFKEEELTSLLKMEKNGKYYFKDGHMRCNLKSKDEWISIFNKYFDFIEYGRFIFFEQEAKYPRQYFVLRNSK